MTEGGSRIKGVRAWVLKRSGGLEELEIGVEHVERGIGGIVWVDCCNVTDWQAAAEAIEALDLAHLSRPALGHLFETIDPGVPGGTGTWADPEESAKLATGLGVRFVNGFWANAKIDPGVHGIPVLLFAKVTFLADEGWIITNRTGGLGVTSGVPSRGEPVPLDDLRREVDLNWNLGIKSGGDVAMFMLRGLCASFRPALSAVTRRLQNAELSFTRWVADHGPADLDDVAYRKELMALKWGIETAALDISSLNRRATSLDNAWFRLSPGSAVDAANEAQELIGEAMITCERQGDRVRSGLELIAATVSAEQLRLARQEQQRSAGFERRVGLLAAWLGGPALVAGFFDAMPEIFSHCPVRRAIVMIAAMALVAIVLWWVLDRSEPKGS